MSSCVLIFVSQLPLHQTFNSMWTTKNEFYDNNNSGRHADEKIALNNMIATDWRVNWICSWWGGKLVMNEGKWDGKSILRAGGDWVQFQHRSVTPVYGIDGRRSFSQKAIIDKIWTVKWILDKRLWDHSRIFEKSKNEDLDSITFNGSHFILFYPTIPWSSRPHFPLTTNRINCRPSRFVMMASLVVSTVAVIILLSTSCTHALTWTFDLHSASYETLQLSLIEKILRIDQGYVGALSQDWLLPNRWSMEIGGNDGSGDMIPIGIWFILLRSNTSIQTVTLSLFSFLSIS